MNKTTEDLEQKIPRGNWCNNGGKRCGFFEIKKPWVNGNGQIQSHFCRLQEEFITHKTCGINE